MHEAASLELTAILAAVKLVIVAFGGLITYYAVKAYRNQGQRQFGFLAAGFGIATLGAALGGIVHEIIGTELAVGVIVEGVFVAVGFGLIAYSLRVQP